MITGDGNFVLNIDGRAQGAEICVACEGSGGMAGVGVCSGCGRPACANHLVISTEIWAPGGTTRHVNTWYPFDRSQMLSAAQFEPLAAGADLEAYIAGWSSGRNLCVLCRRAAGRAATQQAQAAEIDEAKRRAARSSEFPSCTDPSRMLELVAAGVDGTVPQLLRAWRLIVEHAGPPTHDIVDLAAAGWRGRGEPREMARSAAWIVPQGVFQKDYSGAGYTYEGMVNAFLGADGRVWAVAGLPSSFMIDAGVQQFQVPHGTTPAFRKFNKYEPNVIPMTNGKRLYQAKDAIGQTLTVLARRLRS
ncbi:hypothetical protein [Actinoplanes sp. HUAS TT8]|uniref:hypothetical protein n=1 Tax=Actinoplanes sp. HUAS TT8 TaxID=3447453 RepID=UPI003F51B8AC